MPILFGTIASSNQQARADTGAMFPIFAATVGSAGAASITFSSIPATYTNLQIRGIARNTGYSGGGAQQQVFVQFNGDTGSNYNSHGLIGNGTSASANFESTQTAMIPSYGIVPMTDAPANTFGGHILEILEYKNTNKYKTLRLLGGVDTNSVTSGYMNLGSGAWRNTNAITSITLFPQAGAFAQFTSYALYGTL
jgi:hypothetical protein